MSDFRKAFWDKCYAAGKKSGAKFPELVAAQCCLESGFGQHISGRHNYLGIKGPGTTKSTKEFYNGQWVEIKAGFMNFPSLEACIDYLVTRWYKDWKGYKGMNSAASREAGARMLKEQNYATDPSYPAKLINLMNRYAPLSK